MRKVIANEWMSLDGVSSRVARTTTRRAASATAAGTSPTSTRSHSVVAGTDRAGEHHRGEGASDRLTVNTLDGDDVVEASGLAAGAMQLTVNGGAGNDVLIGGDGNDVLNGDAGDDVLIGGPDIDALDGGGDDDIVIQLVGDDVLTSATAAGDAVTSATAADEEWLAKHAQIVDVKTVLHVAGKKHTLPRTDVSQLIRDAPSS